MATFSDFLHAVLGGPAIKKIFAVDADGLMQALRDEHPSATQNELVNLFYNAVCDMKDQERWAEAGIKYLGFNTLGAQLKRERYNSPYGRNQREQRRIAIEDGVRENVRKIKENVIAGWICPNGKAVRDNTFGEIRSLGGQFTRLGASGNAKVIIRDTLSDNQIEKLVKAKAA